MKWFWSANKEKGDPPDGHGRSKGKEGTGRLPFSDRNSLSLMTRVLRDPAPAPADVAEGIPPALSALVVRLMAKSPHDRYPNGAALARDLDQIG